MLVGWRVRGEQITDDELLQEGLTSPVADPVDARFGRAPIRDERRVEAGRACACPRPAMPPCLHEHRASQRGHRVVGCFHGVWSREPDHFGRSGEGELVEHLQDDVVGRVGQDAGDAASGLRER